MKLSDLKVGECGKIKYFDLDDKLVKRLKELGFVKDEIVEVLYISTFGDPIIYRIMGSDISLNKYESDRIIVEKYDKDNKWLARRICADDSPFSCGCDGT